MAKGHVEEIKIFKSLPVLVDNQKAFFNDYESYHDQMQDQTGDNSNKKSITHVLLI